MFNKNYRKRALAEAERMVTQYQGKYEETIGLTTDLHGKKETAVEILKAVDEYIHSLSNKPPELEKIMSEINIRRRVFEQEVHDLQIESKKADTLTGSLVGAGTAAGVGVAALGPTVAMGIATTFGTASTGTAIATLSGAAATNAALAWLGGGALAVGGGGIAAGNAFLALAGPVGWAIGGVAITGAGVMASGKNKKIAKKAEEQAREIKKEIQYLDCIDVKVRNEIDAISQMNSGVQETLDRLTGLWHRDYLRLTDGEKGTLMLLMNTSEALSKRIGVKLT